MKKVFIALAILFTILSVIFTVLPLGTLAIIPIIPALLFAFLGFRNAEGKPKQVSRVIMMIAGVLLLVVIGREIFVKDEIEVDTQFEQKKAASEKETAKELEELEGLE
jgi:uncharacterized membrane protein YtjA (UPF0391 family)